MSADPASPARVAAEPGAELPRLADVPHPAGGFRLAVVPTTVGQYWYSLVARGLDRRPAPGLHGFPTAPGTGLRRLPGGEPEFDPELADLPVTGVTWPGAAAYCEWLTERTGVPCRLPTEAEWRHAAEGPLHTRWSLGDHFDRPVYAPAATGPRPVGAGPAGPYGLHDLTGNVFEWCADRLRLPPRSHSPTTASRVIKGGAYTVRNPESFENATVFTADELSTVPYIGFRVLAESVPGSDRG